MKKTIKKKLTKNQMYSIGTNTQNKEQSLSAQQIKYMSLAQVFNKAGKQNYQMGEQGQSYGDFMAMKGIEPNEEGTGRVSMSEIEQIDILFILSKNKPRKIPNQSKQHIKLLLSAYFAKPVKQVFEKLSISNKLSIQDSLQKLQYPIQKKKLNQSNKYSLNALQILDVLCLYKKSNKILICFMDKLLFENDCQINGRACGDGVAVIQYTDNTQAAFQTMLQTSVHQSLHTFGFDHCLAFNCLMNSIVNKQLWLCPCCLRKLMSQIQQSELEWVQNVKKAAQHLDHKQGMRFGEKLVKKLRN